VPFLSPKAIGPGCFATALLAAAGPAAASPVPTRGFQVDTSIRNEVVSFYQAIYMASEGYRERIGWTGVYNSTAAGAEGSVSAEFVGDVERRLNFYRALCGLKADVRVNSGATVRIMPGDAWVPPAGTTKAAAAQRSALMIIRTYPGNGGLSHDPPASSTGWTTAAWNANRNGNLALGYFGPGAVDAYFNEGAPGTSAWNTDVGHRRWLMFPGSTDFATGDTPGSFSSASNTVRPPTNSMYVVPKDDELDGSAAPGFAAYPAAGHFPAPLNSSFWSLSYPGADFSGAVVTLRDEASNLQPVTILSRRGGYGDNTIVWQVPAAAAAKAVTGDRTWNVTVSDIRGAGVPAEHSYPVILIDPNRLNETPLITGSAAPPLAGGVYQVSTVPGAEAMEAGIFLRRATAWSEGAEDGPAAGVIDGTRGTYPFRAAIPGYARTGSKAFRLTFPTRYDPWINGVPEQSFELDRDLLPGPAGQLLFHFRRGLMTPATRFGVEISTDDGFTWTAAGTPWSGVGGGGDAAFQPAAVTLPAAGQPLRVRFRFYLSDPASSLFTHEDFLTDPTGVFIDDITTSGCDWLDRTGSARGPGPASFTLDAATAGTPLAGGQEWWLRARAVLGGKSFSHGPALVVRPAGPLQLSGPARPPVSGADYGFIPDPAADSYHLEVATLGSGEVWTEGAEVTPPPQVGAAIPASYSLYSNLKGFRKSGALAFRLGLSTLDDEEDHFTIERTVVPTAASTLDFWVRRGPMSLTNRLHAEISDDGGATWSSIWNLPGLKKADKAMTLRSIPLAVWADRPVKLRFALRKDPGGSNLKWNAKKSGVWIDDITVTSPSGVLAIFESPVAGDALQVRLDETSAGRNLDPGSSLRIRLRPVTGGTAGDWGPALTVYPVAVAQGLAVADGFAAWLATELPGQTTGFEDDADGDGLANGIEYAFSLDPADRRTVPDRLVVEAGRIAMSRGLPLPRGDLSYGAEWSDDLVRWSSAGVEIRIEGGMIHASAPPGDGRRFLRWKVAEN
jgi:hypothetical protein